MNTTLARLRTFVGAAVVILGIGAIPALAITIDFTQHGQGAFNQNFFVSSGLVFTQGTFVGFVQGDEALVSGPIAGNFLTPVSNLSVNVALGVQAVTNFTLTVYDVNSAQISATTLLLNQVIGDPGYAGFGYFTISLPNIPQPAFSFTLVNQLVSGPSTAFGASSLDFTQTPEPGTAALFALAICLLGAYRKFRQAE